MLLALRRQAAAEKSRRASEKLLSQATLDLLDFVPRISPRYRRPTHLSRLAAALERTEHQAVRAIVNIPPRHSKTETLLHFIAWRLKRRPWETIAYVTYGHGLAVSKSRLAREYAIRNGICLRDDAASVHEWRTQEMGGALFTSIGGPLIGQGANVLIIDDPHKDRGAAESALERENVWEWYTGTGYHRVEPGGSIVCCQTRWHPDDLSGRLLRVHAHENWDVINLPALGLVDEATGQRIADDDGEPLWPEQWSKDELLRKKHIDAYEWRSQFQQAPTDRGGTVFRGIGYYDALPIRYRIGKGIDLATTTKTRSDWSVGIVLVREDRDVGEPIFYVVDVRRAQAEVPVFERELKALDLTWPGSWHWFCSTTERGTAQLLTDRGVFVDAELATTDKLVRAGPVATAWNEGRVKLPRGAPWLKAFVDEVSTFSGNDKHDDQVDALASAFETVRHGAGKAKTVPGCGSRYGAERGWG